MRVPGLVGFTHIIMKQDMIFLILGLQMVPNFNPPHLQLNVKVWGTFLCYSRVPSSRKVRLAKV